MVDPNHVSLLEHPAAEGGSEIPTSTCNRYFASFAVAVAASLVFPSDLAPEAVVGVVATMTTETDRPPRARGGIRFRSDPTASSNGCELGWIAEPKMRDLKRILQRRETSINLASTIGAAFQGALVKIAAGILRAA